MLGQRVFECRSIEFHAVNRSAPDLGSGVLQGPALDTRALMRREVAVVASDKSPVVYDLSVKPNRDDNGRVIGIIGTASDNTERKRFERSRRRVTHASD